MAFGAACGALLAATLNGPVLGLLFALQSCWYGAWLLLSRCGTDARAEGRGAWQHYAQLPPWLAAPPMAAFCACVGMGGGSFVTPFLLRQRVPFRNAVATAGALNLCIALGGSAAFALSSAGGSGAAACVPAALLLAGGAMASVTFGVSLAHRVPAVVLRRLIGVVNVVSATTLGFQLTLQ
ncbi:MAG: sulfite exporter TauE/SafE family protein, partial [Chitinophagaceae bacterium]|nr:sulfite exporter TauE/SafE family protein [Rubrivivax sp.]